MENKEESIPFQKINSFIFLFVQKMLKKKRIMKVKFGINEFN